MILIMWIVNINKKICVEASKVLLSKKHTEIKSTIECKCKVLLNSTVKINLTFWGKLHVTVLKSYIRFSICRDC